MFRHLAIAAVAALGLGGCVSDYAYRDGGGVGDYYYGRPSVQYSDYGYGAPYGSLYGYPGGYGGYGGGLSLGYGYGGYGYGGYGSPYGYGNGGYGGYYPYYPPYYWHGNHGHGNDDGNGNDHDNKPRRVTGGRLPPSMSQGGSASRSQIMSGGGSRSRVGGQPMRPPGSILLPGRGSAPMGGPSMSRPPMSRPSGPSMRPQPVRSGGPAMSRPSPRMSAPVSRPIQRAAPVTSSPSSVRSRAPASRNSEHVREVEP